MTGLSINPWLSIWIHPRKTIAALTQLPKDYGIWILSTICGFLCFVNGAQFYSLGSKLEFWTIILIAILVAPFLGYIYLTIASWIVFICGKFFKGLASFRECRLALAWSYVPLIVNVLTWILMMLGLGDRLFLYFPGGESLEPKFVYFVLLISIVQVTFAVWALVVYLQALSQVQGYSMAWAIANMVLASMLFLVLIFIMWLVAAMLWVHII